MRVLWVTNDLPPRVGGIQQFVGNLLERVYPETTVVVGPAGGAEVAEHDARLPYRVVRCSGTATPSASLRRRVLQIGRRHAPEVVVLGAAWPLGELAPALERELAAPVVALSHGHEAGLATVGLGRLITRATRGLAALTTISDFSERRLTPHVAAPRVVRVPPGVDLERFRPKAELASRAAALRAAWGVPDGAPLVGCISRLVRRKGQDTLLEAWPSIRARHPEAWLALIGEGPLGPSLRRQVARLGEDARVAIVGRVTWDDLPAAHAALDVFAMPCRTRLAGLDVEGLGIVYLEAAASGVPSVAGSSGGAPEAVADGVTGRVVDGRDVGAVVASLDAWLADPAARRAAGLAGRRWVQERWSWDHIAGGFRRLLHEVASDARGAAGR